MEEKLESMDKVQSNTGDITDLKNELQTLHQDTTKSLREKDSLLEILNDKE